MKPLPSKLILLLIFLLALGLRFYHLGINPPSPYWEEAAIGYDVYSILKTGKDFHGNSWPLVAFESFGDYKPSLYFYTAVPAIALFGLNVFAVRFPSALFGSLTVLLIYLLSKELKIGNWKLNILAALLLAISPWHLQLSRAGFEANLGLFFVVLGAWLFFKGLKKPKYFALCALSFAFSLYAYHADRLFVPLLGLSFGLFHLKKLWQNKFSSLLAMAIFFILAWPLATKLNTAAVKQRFAQTSAFATLEPIIKSNQLIEVDDDGRLAKLIHHRFWHYKDIFIDHYLDQFNFNFLFLSGDTNPRHSTQLVGSLYLIQLPLLFWGILLAFKRKDQQLWPLIIWLLLAPVPAALTKATPHALRSLPMLIPLTIISAYALIQLIKEAKKSLVMVMILIVFSLGLLFEHSRYLFIYYRDYPRLYSQHWQYGYQQMVNYVAQNQDSYDQIYITRQHGRPSIYYWFYTQADPRLVQALNNQIPKDQGEYLQFNQISFGLPDSDKLMPNSLIVTSGQTPSSQARLLKEIKALDNQVVFSIYQR